MKTPVWQRKEGQSKKGGLNEKGRKALQKAGMNIREPVTEKNPKGSRKKRKTSYCARSKGQQEMHNIDCSKTPEKRLCKARKRWRC